MKKLKQNTCIECGDIGVRCKELCTSCYYKKIRNTPEGKSKVKLYNDTKGIEAKKRYFAKKPPKPTKEKIICECGKISVVKGFCFNCYHKYYQRKKHMSKPRLKTKYTKKIDYNLILNLVKNGFTIQNACKQSNIDRSFFYKVITPQQKIELKSYKIINNKINNYGF